MLRARMQSVICYCPVPNCGVRLFCISAMGRKTGGSVWLTMKRVTRPVNTGRKTLEVRLSVVLSFLLNRSIAEIG